MLEKRSDRWRGGTAKRSIGEARRGTVSLLLLVFPLLLSVDLFNISDLLDLVVNVWKVISAIIVALLYINRVVSGRSAFGHLVPMLLVTGLLGISTFLNEGSFRRYWLVWGGFLVICLLVEVFIRDKPRQLMLALKCALGSIVIINFATVVLVPSGLWSVGDEGFWVLGHRNNFGTPLIAAIVVGAAYDFMFRRRLSASTVIVGAAATGSVLLTWSASSVVTVIVMFAIVLLVAFGRGGSKLVRPFFLVISYAIVDIGVVVFRIQNHFSNFLTDVLDRSSDLTGRTRIWEIVEEKVRESPFFGYGIQLTENNGLTIYNKAYVHAHNGELDILLNGGIVTFVPYVVLVVSAALAAGKHFESRAVRILLFGLVVVLFRSITGLFFSSYSLLLVYLVLNSETLARCATDVEVRPD